MTEITYDVRIVPGRPLSLVVFDGEEIITELPMPTEGAVYLLGRLFQALASRVDWKTMGDMAKQQIPAGPLAPTIN